MQEDKTKPDQVLYNQGPAPTIPGNPFILTNPIGDSTTPDPGIKSQPQETSISPLAGFLVTFSRVEEGEFFPIHYGNNLIGSGTTAKIPLNEERVSKEHLNILVWPDEDNNCLYVQVVAKESTNPISIDGKKIMQIGQGIKIDHGTRITVGGYELLVVIVDKYVLGLKKNPDFKAKSNPKDYSDPFFSMGRNIDPNATM
jgi:FHA domain